MITLSRRKLGPTSPNIQRLITTCRAQHNLYKVAWQDYVYIMYNEHEYYIFVVSTVDT